MAGESAPFGNRTRPAGLIGSLFALASALADFFESRAALFATESKAAALQFVIAALCLVMALMFFAFGYLFLIGTIVVAIARFAQVSWLWTALSAAGIHLVVALCFGLIGLSNIRKPVFRTTTAELKKDREWLKNLETNHPPS